VFDMLVEAGAELVTGAFLSLDYLDDDKVEVAYRDKERGGQQCSAVARTIIGADGARSRVARQCVPGADKLKCVFAYHEIVRSPERSDGADFDPARCDVWYQGRLSPDLGRVELGARLQVAYFDQMRAQLDEEKSVQDNVADGSDRVEINGRSKHIIGYLQDFLFSPDRARTPVKALSGGERNRLLLARLFTRPANVLVMDEPTNDLDVETLELLEDLLLEYPGTLLLVSHDRAFLNNVVTSCLVFEGEARVREYVGDYDDWLRQRPPPPAPDKADKPKAAPKPVPPARPAARLSYKEQRELEGLPARIEALETEQEQLREAMGDPAFYQQEPAAIADANARLQRLAQDLEQVYERWETLEARRG